MYKINYNGKGSCNLRIVDRSSLGETLIKLLDDGYNVHYVKEIRNA